MTECFSRALGWWDDEFPRTREFMTCQRFLNTLLKFDGCSVGFDHSTRSGISTTAPFLNSGANEKIHVFQLSDRSSMHRLATEAKLIDDQRYL